MTRDEQRRLLREGCVGPETPSVPPALPYREPVPCDPPVTPPDEEFLLPTTPDELPGAVLPTPVSTVTNPTFQVACEDDQWGYVSDVLVDPSAAATVAPTLTDTFFWTSIASLSEVQLATLSVRTDLPTYMEVAWSDEQLVVTRTAAEIAADLGLTLVQAEEAVAAVLALAAALVESAELLGASLLDCHYRNVSVLATCADDGVGEAVLISAGTVRGASQDDADNQAEALAASSLRCVWYNTEVTRRCSDLVETDVWDDIPDGRQEFRYTDALLGYVDQLLSTRVGSYTVPALTFTSDVSRADVQAQAAAFADSQLACFYTAAAHEECAIQPICPSLPPYADPVTGALGGIADIPEGLVINYDSQAAADVAAYELALSLLECSYCNDEIIRNCDQVYGQSVTVLGGATAPIYWDTDLSSSYVDDQGDTQLGARVEAGSVFSDVSPADANEQAELLALSQMVCHTCNVCVPPLCQDPAVVANTDCEVNPAEWQGEGPFDVLYWAQNATLGVAAGTFCTSNDPQAAQDAANTLGVIPYSSGANQAVNDSCLYDSEEATYSCLDVFVDDVGAQREDTRWLSPRSSRPVSIPAGLVQVTLSEVPVSWPQAGSAGMTAVSYANYLAKMMVRSMLDCFWENPAGTAFCDMSYSASGGAAPTGTRYNPSGAAEALKTALDGRYQTMLEWWAAHPDGLSQDAPIALDGLVMGDHKRTSIFGRTMDVAASCQGGEDEPVMLAQGQSISAVSFEDMQQQIMAFTEGSLDCWWANAPFQVYCGAKPDDLKTSDEQLARDQVITAGDGAIGTGQTAGTVNQALHTGIQSTGSMPSPWPIIRNGNAVTVHGPPDIGYRDEVDDVATGSDMLPVVVAASLFRSGDSPYFADLQALEMGIGQLDCFLFNDEQSAECPAYCDEDPDDEIPPTANIPTENCVWSAVVPARNIISYVSKYAANMEASTTAFSMLQCESYNEEQTSGPCDDPDEILLFSVTIEARSIAASTTCEANALAQSLVDSLRQCVREDQVDLQGHAWMAFYDSGGGGGGGGGGGLCPRIKIRARESILYDYDGKTIVYQMDAAASRATSREVCEEAEYILHVNLIPGMLEFSDAEIYVHEGDADPPDPYKEPWGPAGGPQTYFNVKLATVKSTDDSGERIFGSSNRPVAQLTQLETSPLYMTETTVNGLTWVTASSSRGQRPSVEAASGFAIRAIFPWGMALDIPLYVVRVNTGRVNEKPVRPTLDRPIQPWFPISGEPARISAFGPPSASPYWDCLMEKDQVIKVVICTSKTGIIAAIADHPDPVVFEFGHVNDWQIGEHYEPEVINGGNPGKTGIYHVPLFQLKTETTTVGGETVITVGVDDIHLSDIDFSADLWTGQNMGGGDGSEGAGFGRVLKQFNRATGIYEYRAIEAGEGVTVEETEETIKISVTNPYPTSGATGTAIWYDCEGYAAITLTWANGQMTTVDEIQEMDAGCPEDVSNNPPSS